MSDIKTFEIQPSTIEVDSFKIPSISILVGQNTANVNVELYGNNQFIMTRSLHLSGEEYVSWGSDYPFLLSWVCTQLGFTLA
jgi:hypothetical protein